jgi:hypothetical protein
MDTNDHNDLVRKARDFCRRTQEMQKIMNDMYFWEFVDLDEKERREQIQQECKVT